ncbi:MAG: DUF2461 domain-containing protein [Reichenbachiella sp.]
MKTAFDFLKQIDENNNREWFSQNKKKYEIAHQEMIEFADRLLFEMNKHDIIETPSGKRSLYRIYRDVRFRKDKTPYKTNWAGGLKRATADLRGGYYYQVGPKGSFVMGGFFGPNADDLLHIRRQLSQHAEPLRDIINGSEFINFFGELKGNQLKTAPRGFEKDHLEIDLLRYKQFMVRHDFTEKEVMGEDFHLTVVQAFKNMRPFFNFMSEILTTDLNGESIV